MNNKGYTLIELIVTIALLAIISTISFVAINSAIQKSKDKECENIRNSLKSAAVVYFSNHRYDSTTKTEVTYSELQAEKVITGDTVKDPYTGSNLDTSGIKVKKDGTVTGLPNNCQKYN